uniref:Uncharacterized protein n=1 Tax=Chromera velia CCMP2878 TaxID=1169474 RepID=A0A0G4I2V6_9ALVE|eukprot:Cvel_10505.t1-p1 / transcript=Cvel_10505.t1 / gene=Cvel_10505 / organism=Chromera_velia_CCMP2878 / gene_product=26S proteasome non-ATPase regulatory subunit 1, putative / transcript_product=26S proteasome non-ATPase regulatory subunit 1, putative / location=Cvel_scaffold635:31114-44153(-) / protein_length=1086 / sequence_SO=supercontig / SO=protein_coding / is_pseudo=false
MAAAAVAMPQSSSVTSAAGILALLQEDNDALCLAALERLNFPGVIEQFWAEIAENLSEIEFLYERDDFTNKELAALVASKVYYHLEQYEETLRFALGAGPLFDVTVKSQYVDTVVAECIDEYIRRRVELDEYDQFSAEKKEKEKAPDPMDPRLEAIVEGMFARCVAEGMHRQALGVALDARRLDKVQSIITGSPNPPELLQHTVKQSVRLVGPKAYRNRVLRLLVGLFENLPESKLRGPQGLAVGLSHCLFLLGDAERVATILAELVNAEDENSHLVALQIACDIHETKNGQFLQSLLTHEGLALPPEKEPPAAPAAGAEATGDAAASATAAAGTTGEEGASTEQAPLLQEEAPSGVKEEEPEDPKETARVGRMKTLRSILNGSALGEASLQFLTKRNKSDLLILDTVKGAVDPRQSIPHSGIVFAHGLMQAGTTSDAFLRGNLEWLGKAVNWAKFSATASLGVVHQGQIKDGLKVLQSYLPGSGGGSSSSFSEAGSLYALGLIHGSCPVYTDRADSEALVAFLLDQLRTAQSNETRQHGACLGLGLARLGCADESLYDELKAVLFQDSAVAGEAAGYAIGLLMLGTQNQRAISELLAYAHDTQHEKIIRACAMALALLVFGKEAQADAMIEQLCTDSDALLRYGGMYACGLAYCGTSRNGAIQRLLSASVSDVNDDVRRAAVTNIGFVMCGEPKAVPRVVSLLTDSYNPHVRYASALALGIACAGTGLQEAVSLLLKVASDGTDFVREGAFLALGLCLMNVPEGVCDRVKKATDLLFRVVKDKHEDVMARFGATIGLGLLNAGGRNVQASLYPRGFGIGTLRAGAAAGLALFTQLWYWFPLIHMVSLSFQPAAFIGLNEKAQVPLSFEARCVAEEGTFAYPKPLEREKKEEKTKTAVAVLSTTKKKQEEAKKKKTAGGKDAQGDETMDAAGEASAKAAASGVVDVIMVDASGSKEKEGEKKEGEAAAEAKKKKGYEALKNPYRVIVQQEPFMAYPTGTTARYAPVFTQRKGGFVVLKDLKPGEPETYLHEKGADSPKGKDEKDKEGEDKEKKDEEKKEGEGDKAKEEKKEGGDEPPPPEAFEWSG